MDKSQIAKSRSTMATNRLNISNTRGHSMKLYKDRVNRDVLKFSFANRVIEQWNKLPETVVNVNSVNTFKNKLDTFLKAKEGN